MPVTIEEYIKIKGFDGVEKEGKAVANQLVAIEDTIEGGYAYGQLLGIARVRTRIECDLGEACTQGKIDEEFKTHPKIIEFDDSGAGPGNFIKDVAEVTIASDYKGQKLVFCSFECLAKYSRKASKANNVIEFPAGKGARTFNESGS